MGDAVVSEDESVVDVDADADAVSELDAAGTVVGSGAAVDWWCLSIVLASA